MTLRDWHKTPLRKHTNRSMADVNNWHKNKFSMSVIKYYIILHHYRQSLSLGPEWAQIMPQLVCHEYSVGPLNVAVRKANGTTFFFTCILHLISKLMVFLKFDIHHSAREPYILFVPTRNAKSITNITELDKNFLFRQTGAGWIGLGYLKRAVLWHVEKTKTKSIANKIPETTKYQRQQVLRDNKICSDL